MNLDYAEPDFQDRGPRGPGRVQQERLRPAEEAASRSSASTPSPCTPTSTPRWVSSPTSRPCPSSSTTPRPSSRAGTGPEYTTPYRRRRRRARARGLRWSSAIWRLESGESSRSRSPEPRLRARRRHVPWPTRPAVVTIAFTAPRSPKRSRITPPGPAARPPFGPTSDLYRRLVEASRSWTSSCLLVPRSGDPRSSASSRASSGPKMTLCARRNLGALAGARTEPLNPRRVAEAKLTAATLSPVRWTTPNRSPRRSPLRPFSPLLRTVNCSTGLRVTHPAEVLAAARRSATDESLVREPRRTKLSDDRHARTDATLREQPVSRHQRRKPIRWSSCARPRPCCASSSCFAAGAPMILPARKVGAIAAR